MNTRNIKRTMLIGACLAMVPMAASAEYLKGETAYKPLSGEGANVPKGDMAGDYEYTDGSSGDLAKRQRVESRVQTYMKQYTTGDTGEHVHSDDESVTPQQFQELVAKAQQGDAASIGGVGYAYQHGLGTARNEKQALAWYSRAIEYGETQYFAEIGEMYRDYSAAKEKPGFMSGLRNAIGGTGDDLPDDDVEARKWFEKGVYAKDWQSYTKLGEMYRDGAGGLEKDAQKANWYYNEGLKMKKRRDQLIMKELEQRARAQAELEEGLRDNSTPVIGGQGESTSNTVMIGDNVCALLDMQSPTTQYSVFYEAYCNGLDDAAKNAAPATVVVKGLTCNVTTWPANVSKKDYELRCK